ncbi:EEF1A lysine methyltransferase 1 [Cylas formicarius]|uniref:EEF1A lysine methyltransferase 1 n=1 Tax=Cylas formicarius TaxID=197179 RepID=UPI0029586007|nr:EEF1A lysine methyltransferase 1 [Cylas formicarius]
MTSALIEDDVPRLSGHAMEALAEFYREQEERKAVEIAADTDFVFHEDWQLSQFWYDEDTIDKLSTVAVKAAGPNSKIALVSCPSLFRKTEAKAGDNVKVTLFEYDTRFAAYGSSFVFYDYNSPQNIPQENKHDYDLVVADPPFLSEECLTKTAVAIKFLTKGKIILCTGTKMAELAQKLLDVRDKSFKPKHKSNLCNDFSCFSNLDIDQLL